MKRRPSIVLLLLLILVTAGVLLRLGHVWAQAGCATSGPPSSNYSITLCITTPADGAIVTGDQTVIISAAFTGTSPGVDDYVFYLDGAYLLTDMSRLGTFELPTEKFVDAERTLAVEALMKDGFVSDRASVSLTFNNGIVEPPVNNNTFTPHTGSLPPAGQSFVLAAVGDGASGYPTTIQVSDLILSWDPDIFIYLGDVYEKGSIAEFHNWYGDDSRYFGRMRAITNPTIGNHEHDTGNTDGYFDYWDNVPHFYSYDAAGWHIISLDSNSYFNQTTPGTDQYDWLVQDLSENTLPCSLVYFHHPRFSIGSHGDDSSLQDIWSLLAQNGVAMVVNGHEHNYQRWSPLDGSGNPATQGLTQFIVGGGGKNITSFTSSDSRLVTGFDSSTDGFGALRLELNEAGAAFQYVRIDGTILDSGVIPCSGSSPDTEPPTTPVLTGKSDEAGHIMLSWSGSVDNVGVAEYIIDRNGVELTSVDGGVHTYTDDTVQLNSTYVYSMTAVDSASNRSAPSNSVTVTAQSSTLVFGPTDDATIAQNDPGMNYGAEMSLEVDGSPLEAVMLRFEISGIGTYSVTSAVLQLYVTDGSNAGGEFAIVSDTAWNEESVTWDNAPAGDGGSLGALGSVSTDNWYELDVTPLVTGDGPVSLRITSTSANGATYSSKENANGNGPVLTVIFDRTGDIDLTPPSQPANLRLSAVLTDSVTIEWDASTDNVGVTGYDIFRDQALISAAGVQTSYFDLDVGPGTTYAYHVRARDAAGNVSEPSNTIEVTTPELPVVGSQPAPPYRLAFYYPWFPNAWTQHGIFPYTNYDPMLGAYDSSDVDVIRQHVGAMEYGGIEGAIASWWGQGHHTDLRMATILSATGESKFRWSVYHEGEGQGDPSAESIRNDLVYLHDNYGTDPNYFRIDGRFVVFVYADPADDCDMAARWSTANDLNAFIVLKVFPGYRNCPTQPDGWHQYAPAVAADDQGSYSYTISPGFWKVNELPRLERDLARWRQNIRDMVDSGAMFQLVTTFNEWGEGTSVEAAEQWDSASGYGQYLDALHTNGLTQTVTVTPSTYLPLTIGGAPSPAEGVVLVGAGDIVDCNDPEDEMTAALLDAIPGIVFTAGDNVYDDGKPEEFNNCYAPSWGRHKARTRPAPGNHDYNTAGAAGYFGYFGAAAGDPDKGYYSYDHGDWHIIVLNSNCSTVGGCDAGSEQELWLQADLAANPVPCTLAYWHHPLFSSGSHGSDGRTRDLWQALYDAGVDVVLNGHDHQYERFAPQDPAGKADPEQGIRQFTVGTGGRNLTSGSGPIANSQVINDDVFGVLKLTLHSDSYEWSFVPVAGSSFVDSGNDSCH